MHTEKGTINISEHIESAAKDYLKNEGKPLIEEAVQSYFNGKKYSSRKKAEKELNVSPPTLRKYERQGLIAGVVIAGRVCFSADEVERVKVLKLRYKRD